MQRLNGSDTPNGSISRHIAAKLIIVEVCIDLNLPSQL